MVLRCNHTVIYEGQEERQGPLLQLLKVSGMNSVYNMFTLSLDFHITASLFCLQMVMETHALKVSVWTQPPTVLVCCFLFSCFVCL